jgi:hypothetical protein
MSKFRDTRYQWQRPNFYVGERMPDKFAGDIPKRFTFTSADSRDRLHRRETNFTTGAIRQRNLEAFEGLKSLNEELYGAPVQVSMVPFKIELPDPNDVNWLTEYNRRLTAGETAIQIKNDPPFGRQQKTTNQLVDFNTLVKNVGESLRVLSTIVNKRNVDDKTIQSTVVPTFIKTLGNLPEDDTLNPSKSRHIKNINDNIPKLITADFNSLGLNNFYRLTDLTKSKMGEEKRGKLIKYLIDISDDGKPFDQNTVVGFNVDEKGNTTELTINNIFGKGRSPVTSGWVNSKKEDFFLNAKTGEVLHDSQMQGASPVMFSSPPPMSLGSPMSMFSAQSP